MEGAARCGLMVSSRRVIAEEELQFELSPIPWSRDYQKTGLCCPHPH